VVEVERWVLSVVVVFKVQCVMRVTLFVCYVFLFLVLSLRLFELFFALGFGIETVVVEVLVVCFISIKIIESIFVL